MSNLKNKLRRLGYIESEVVRGVNVVTQSLWEGGYVTSVEASSFVQDFSVCKGIDKAIKDHNKALADAHRLYSGVWSPEKYQEGSEK